MNKQKRIKKKRGYKAEESFRSRVDRVLAGTYATGELVPVCFTPKLIQEIGFDPLMIAIKQKHIRDILKPEDNSNGDNFHGLKRGYFNNLPAYLADPAMIFKSLSHPDNSIVLVTDALDDIRRPIIIALACDKQGMINQQDIVCNLVASTYGREKFIGFLSDSCKNDGLLYIDKKKSQALSDSIRVQFPQALTTLNSNGIIRRFDKIVKPLEQKNDRMTDEIHSQPHVRNAYGSSVDILPRSEKNVKPSEKNRPLSPRELYEAERDRLRSQKSNTHTRSSGKPHTRSK